MNDDIISIDGRENQMPLLDENECSDADAAVTVDVDIDVDVEVEDLNSHQLLPAIDENAEDSTDSSGYL